MTKRVQLPLPLLISRFLTNSLTESEKKELDNWLNESPINRSLFDKWTNIPYLMGKAEADLEIQAPPPDQMATTVLNTVNRNVSAWKQQIMLG